MTEDKFKTDDVDSVRMRDLLDFRWRLGHYFQPNESVTKMIVLIDDEIDKILAKSVIQKGPQ